ncbi:MAG: glycosyl transferase [Chitinophagaceae bacterium]|nr:glycosyl transferase [Chitinophagaceae bacterium]
MKILLYFPSNKRTIAMETMVKQYIDSGHEVLLLTQCERGAFHAKLEEFGVKTFVFHPEKVNRMRYYFRHITYLIGFCRKNHVEAVVSHLQAANIIAVVAQFFIHAPVIVFRHHDYAKNKKEKWADELINFLAKRIVVPSSGVKKMMLANEWVKPSKVEIVPYIYNFSNYNLLDHGGAGTIRQRYQSSLLLIMVSRLVEEKRHLLVFDVVRKLIQEGKDIKLMVMDEGTIKDSLEQYIRLHHLQDKIFMLGFQTNIIDYISAADVMVHPSLAEASCSAVKEAGLKEKIVIACHEVGDFDDYIVHKSNGFLMDKEKSEEQLYVYLQEILNRKEELQSMGKKLRTTILETFSPSKEVAALYNRLLVYP